MIGFFAAGKPVPWKAPEIFMKTSKVGKRYRTAAKDKHLTAWQKIVRTEATEAIAKEESSITLAPLDVRLTFLYRSDDPELVEACVPVTVTWSDKTKSYVKKGAGIGDVDNLAKAVLDAMEGVVYGNDAQIVTLTVSRRYGDRDGVAVRVRKDLDVEAA